MEPSILSAYVEAFSYQVILSEWLWLRGAKWGGGRKNPIRMLTFRQSTMQCCHHPLTQFHSPPLQFIQNHPLSESSTLGLLSSSMKSIDPVLQNMNISLVSHHIFADLNVKSNAIVGDKVLSLHQKEVCFETNFSFGCFPRQLEFTEQGPRSVGGVNTTTRNEGPHSAAWNTLKWHTLTCSHFPLDIPHALEMVCLLSLDQNKV